MVSKVNPKSLQKIQETLENFTVFLGKYRWILQVNTVGFFTESLWHRVVLPQLGDAAVQLTNLPEADMARVPAGQLPQHGESNLALQTFIGECLAHRLERTEFLRGVDELLADEEMQPFSSNGPHSTSGDQSDTVIVKPRTMMSVKKSHEVEEMSRVVARLAKLRKLKKVVDIGSGKGYLGQYVSLQHGLQVIGVDSSNSNTHGALARNAKLRKHWKSLSKQSAQRKDDQSETPRETFKDIYTRRTRKAQQMQEFQEQKLPNHAEDVMNMHGGKSQSEGAYRNTGAPTSQSDVPSPGTDLEAMNMQQHLNGQPSVSTPNQSTKLDAQRNHDCSDARKCGILLKNNNHHENTVSPSTDSTIQKTATENNSSCESRGKLPISDTHPAQDSPNSTKPHAGASYSPVTAFVEPDTSINSVVSDKDCGIEDEQPYMLTGLHTCGDLAPSMLRLFAHNDAASVLLNVGCCYHHITEEFETEGWNLPDIRPDVFGFPMSQYLRSKGTVITRPGRMLAVMASDRIAMSQLVPAMGLFYRSVLQVLLQDHYRIATRSEQVGKLAPKCQNFLQYARKALKKLKFDDSKLTDREINEYSDRYRPYFAELQAINQLRASLSPTVEGLIMLDRLCYLHEQNAISQAVIVRLFDPVTSPRCYAILATR